MGSFNDVTTDDGTFATYVAIPPTSPAPVIVVLQEIFGVNADLRETCDELAAQGYFAVSPDLFWRQERGVDLSDQSDAEWQKGLSLYGAFDYQAGLRDVAATVAYAHGLPGANGKVGLMGYCFGGLMTFRCAVRNGVDAAVAYYGGGTEKYLSEASGLDRPLMIHIGEEDEYITRDAQRAIRGALASNPKAHVWIYPGAKHAFARHRGINYQAATAATANARTAAFFREHLVAR